MSVHRTVLDSGLVDLAREVIVPPTDVFPHLPPSIIVGDGVASFSFAFPTVEAGNPPTQLWVAIFAPGSVIPVNPDDVLTGAGVVGQVAFTPGEPVVTVLVSVDTVPLFAPSQSLIKDAIYVPVIEHLDVV